MEDFVQMGVVLERDLNATAMPPITAEWVGAVYTPEKARNVATKGTACALDSLVAELEQADEYVIGVPMHANFRGAPSRTEALDRPDRTCRPEHFPTRPECRRVKLLGKKATFIIATGGIYDAQTQMASFNFVEPYLRSVFGFLGVTDATFLTASGTSVLNQGHDREAFLAPHLQAVQTYAGSLQESVA